MSSHTNQQVYMTAQFLAKMHCKQTNLNHFSRNPLSRLCIRCLLRFEYQLPHPILCTTLATDKKWPLSHFHISYQNSEISWQKMDLILVNKMIFFYEIFFRKIRIIFDIENWLWKSEISTFGQLISEFW